MPPFTVFSDDPLREVDESVAVGICRNVDGFAELLCYLFQCHRRLSCSIDHASCWLAMAAICTEGGASTGLEAKKGSCAVCGIMELAIGAAPRGYSSHCGCFF
ncbi:hypothetical protein F0562_003507 [Nyssa sinensis]|uniref:Uncharacterized protein n=1 Tax=Nyssa sinensis TaxID=561372 RepID=A0A5J5BW87_9ASTE|nr:hypothetical protein F0562_003507 [Nyssa sinensis]